MPLRLSCTLLLVGAALALPGAVPAVAAPRADLRVALISEPPSRMSPGDRFQALAIVRNAGRRKAPRTTTRFHLTASVRNEREPRIPLSARRTHRLRPGSETIVTDYVTVPSDVPSGREYFLVACADASDRVRESDERRNCFASALLMFVEAR